MMVWALFLAWRSGRNRSERLDIVIWIVTEGWVLILYGEDVEAKYGERRYYRGYYRTCMDGGGGRELPAAHNSKSRFATYRAPPRLIWSLRYFQGGVQAGQSVVDMTKWPNVASCWRGSHFGDLNAKGSARNERKPN